jgi:adenine-specific DNA methylase
MKYMGSKRVMLQNGLGKLLVRESRGASRFVDLFSGSGAVSWHVAKKTQKPVLAVDLQSFAAVLAGAILRRTEPVDAETSWKLWQVRASGWLASRFERELKEAKSLCRTHGPLLLRRHVIEARHFCSQIKKASVTHAYGGYYFSPLQALWIDALRATLPRRNPERDVALASLVEAASQCAAAPGHTAQPFGNTPTAREWIHDAWKRDVVAYAKKAFSGFAAQYAMTKGKAYLGNANQVARKLRKGDLAFVDPPYSGVHYSRFYHVLETIARGRQVTVTGTGRYPSITRRPQSKYSMNGQSKKAFDDLLKTLARRRVRVVLTFPAGKTSNGLSGSVVERLTKKYFLVRRKTVKSRFSTLGGNGEHREARLHTPEMILVLRPKRIKATTNARRAKSIEL